MRVLVTGGAGFIGSHVADRLLADGHRVVCLDNFDPYYDPAQKRRNVQAATAAREYSLVEGDIRDRALVERVFDEHAPDLVVHLAAKAGVRSSVADPISYVEVNELGGLHVLEACRARGGTPLALASTSSVYGQDDPPFDESQAATTPLSPYAASKRGSELMAHAFHAIHGQPCAVLRFFTVYGPRGRPDMAVATFTERLRRGEPIWLHGEATARDFTFVDDIVDGVVRAAHWCAKERGFGVFNLGRSEPTRVRELIEVLADILGVDPDVRLRDLQPGESPITAARIGAARDHFGYSPRTSLREGLERWVRWLDGSPESPTWVAAPARESGAPSTDGRA